MPASARQWPAVPDPIAATGLRPSSQPFPLLALRLVPTKSAGSAPKIRPVLRCDAEVRGDEGHGPLGQRCDRE